MKKAYFVLAVIVLLPLLSIAQNEGEVSKDFKKKSLGLTKKFKFDEHTWIIETMLDNGHFSVDAINDQMEDLWTVELEGYAHYVGKFKGKIITVASTDFGVTTSYNSTYKAYLLNPTNGETEVEKNIFERPDNYLSQPFFSNSEDGSYFKMLVRQANIERRTRIAIAPLALFTLNGILKDFDHSHELTEIELNDKLEVTSTISPVVGNGILYDVEFNPKGSMFLSWLNDKSLSFEKYGPGKEKPSLSMEQPFVYKGGSISVWHPIKTCLSKANPDILFYSIFCKNENGDYQLNVGKVDFSNNTKQLFGDALTKDNIKALEKAFVPINKKVDKPDIGYLGDLSVRDIIEKDAKLVIEIFGDHTFFSTQSTGAAKTFQYSFIFCVYDMALNPLPKTLFPNHDGNMIVNTSFGLTLNNNTLYVLGNVSSGRSNTPLYGEYDLNENQWNKMEFLGKKGIGGPPQICGEYTMWFADGFIVPYYDVNTNLMGRPSFTIDLQHITN